MKSAPELPGKDTADAQLLRSASAGDEAAFRILYERHRDAVFRFAYRLLGSVEAAEDITQECFLSVLGNNGRYDAERAQLRTYFYGTARNLAFKRFRAAGRETTLEDLPEEPAAAAPEPLAQLLGEELVLQVRRAIEALPVLQREALVLFEYEELSLAEIAAVVQADVGTVKARLHRARERLKRTLAPHFALNETTAMAQKS